MSWWGSLEAKYFFPGFQWSLLAGNMRNWVKPLSGDHGSSLGTLWQFNSSLWKMAIEIVNMYLLKMVGNPELTVGSPKGKPKTSSWKLGVFLDSITSKTRPKNLHPLLFGASAGWAAWQALFWQLSFLLGSQRIAGFGATCGNFNWVIGAFWWVISMISTGVCRDSSGFALSDGWF